jgi:glycosyltransferase involved in cell wall biosynthesis
MHILHVTPYYTPAYTFGGVVRAVEGMAHALTARGHQITILTTDALSSDARYEGVDDEIIDGIRVIRCKNVSPFLRGKVNLSTPRRMRQTAQKVLSDVDVVHIHEFRTVENLLVTPVAYDLKKPIVLSPHGTLNLSTGRGRLKVGWDKLLSAGVALRIDHVVALVESELEDVQTLWQTFGRRQTPTQFSVIPNGIDSKDFASLPPANEFRIKYNLDDVPTILFMGRLHARKGVDVLIKAFKLANVDNSRLLIVGPDEGMLDTISSLADGDSRIVITGHLGGEERLNALSAGDVFVLPAVGEGLSMAVLEAMGAGLPLVLSHGCNMTDVEPNGAGYVVDVSPNAIADKLRLLLTDPDLRQQMGQASRNLIAQKYTWDKVALQLDSVYQQVAHVK